MKLSRNIKIYTVINLISSLLFFTFLARGVLTTRVEGEANTYVSSLPAFYAVIWFFSGLVLAGTDKARNSRYNLALAYHVASSAIIVISMIYALIMFEVFRNIEFAVIPIFLMAISFGIHWFVVRNNPKGIDKKDAFK
jgi:CHASE2 domain-containing sensor protein